MARGRKPEPTAALKARGARSAETRSENEWQPSRSDTAPPPPASLTGYGRDVWLQLVPQMYAVGVLTDADMHEFERYCDLWTRYWDLIEVIGDEGTMVDGKPHSAISVSLKIASELRQLGSMFGLNPSSRTKVLHDPAKAREAKGGIGRFVVHGAG